MLIIVENRKIKIKASIYCFLFVTSFAAFLIYREHFGLFDLKVPQWPLYHLASTLFLVFIMLFSNYKCVMYLVAIEETQKVKYESTSRKLVTLSLFIGIAIIVVWLLKIFVFN